MSVRLSRRAFVTRGLAASALMGSGSLAAAPMLSFPVGELIRRNGKRRVVIAGGGWGGLSAARHLRRLVPELEVIVLDRNPFSGRVR
ncbi:hypothetical protein [Orrella marina]|uniref:hypothetical protein n=1 Tax=Orrella marina TaxID=2163011 RepID=UPI001D1310E5|nr:hypothetical protein [Orrella marina]